MKNILFALIIATGGLLTSCSSTPEKSAAVQTQEDKTAFIKSTEERLSMWERKANKLSAAQAANLRALVADTRVELNDLRNSPDFYRHQGRVEERMSRIESRFTAE